MSRFGALTAKRRSIYDRPDFLEPERREPEAVWVPLGEFRPFRSGLVYDAETGAVVEDWRGRATVSEQSRQRPPGDAA
jgi:hypothetical protein